MIADVDALDVVGFVFLLLTIRIGETITDAIKITENRIQINFLIRLDAFLK
jgi:hypothetical protein